MLADANYFEYTANFELLDDLVTTSISRVCAAAKLYPLGLNKWTCISVCHKNKDWNA